MSPTPLSLSRTLRRDATAAVLSPPPFELETLLAIQGAGMEAAAEIGELGEANGLEQRFLDQMDARQEPAYALLRRALGYGHIGEIKAAIRASLLHLGRAEDNEAEARRWDAVVDACTERAGVHVRQGVGIAEGRRRAIQRRRQRAADGPQEAA